MKKLFFAMMMAVVAMTAAGQGRWTREMLEPDELKGIAGGEVISYEDPSMGMLVLWGFDTFQFRLGSTKTMFETERSNGHSGLIAKVGIYDDNNRLTDKFDLWLDREENMAFRSVRTRNAGTMSNPVGQKGKVRKIFDALLSGHGYVRIVAPRYNSTDFDLKITPYTEE